MASLNCIIIRSQFFIPPAIKKMNLSRGRKASLRFPHKLSTLESDLLFRVFSHEQTGNRSHEATLTFVNPVRPSSVSLRTYNVDSGELT